MATLIPAYGRDYKSAKAIETAYEDGIDFKVASPGPYMGAYCSIRDFPNEPVNLRYNQLRNTTVYYPNQED